MSEDLKNNGIENTDFHIFIDTASSGSFAARAGSCELDRENNNAPKFGWV